MDGALPDLMFPVGTNLLDRLMPLHVVLSPAGMIASHGPTIAKVISPGPILGQPFFEVFSVLRPSGIETLSDLAARHGQRLQFNIRNGAGTGFRGLAQPLHGGLGTLINMSFGIGVVDAVRHHDLTIADFAATDLTVELLYLVEAKTAVGHELRDLNLRLQGAKVAAEEQALTDTLTGLGNRRALDLALAVATLGAGPFALMHIDLDYFKAVNDTLGHAAGDRVLCDVARVLREETRTADTVARVGGDEFVVILPGVINPVRLLAVADRIIARLSQPIDFEGQPCRISASIGMTQSTLYRHPDATRMSADADAALYAAKRSGRAQAQMFGTGAGIVSDAEKKWQPVGELNPSSQVENLVS